jgi:hypothetical protein
MRSAKKAMSILDDCLEERLGQISVVVEIRERDLGLDHPEFGKVAAGIRILRPESRAERIDLGQCEAVTLDVELPGYRQKSFPSEKVCREIRLVLVVARNVRKIQRAHTEQLPGAFAIAGGDDGCVYPGKAVVVHVTVNGLSETMAQTRDGTDGIGARAQMGYFAQMLKGMAFGRDRVGLRIVHPTHNFNALRLHLDALAFALRFDQLTNSDDGATGGQVPDFLLVIRQGLVCNNLDGIEARTVVQVDEREPMFGVTTRSHPSLQCHFAAHRHCSGKQFSNAYATHHVFLCVCHPGRRAAERASVQNAPGSIVDRTF